MSLRVHSAGSVEFLAPNTPTFLWNTGQTETLVQTALGYQTGTWLEDAVPNWRNNAVPLVSKRGVLTPGGLVALGFGVATGPDRWNVRSLVELPGAPGTMVAGDIPFDFAWIEIGNREDSDAGIAGACSIEVIAGPDVQIRTNSGAFLQVTRTGIGDYLLELDPQSGYDSAQVVIIATPRGQTFPTLARACGVDHISDTLKRITILEEGPAGGPSIRQDSDVDLIVIAKDAQRKPQLGFVDLRSTRLQSAALWEPGGTPTLLINSGEWEEMTTPSPGEALGLLQAGSGLLDPDGVYVASIYDAQTAPNGRWIQVTRPAGAVPNEQRRVDVYGNELTGATFPTFPANFIYSVVGVSTSS